VKQATYNAIPSYLAKLKPFTGNSMSGRHEVASERGRMPDSEWWTLRDSRDQDRVTYVVYSYHTPIAYVLDDGTRYVTENYYSKTTSRHRELCAAYL